MATRRERLRLATVDEIKTVARAQMAAEGTASVTLRAIAREMGVTASALYRYFGSRDELVTALVTDAYDALADAMEAAVAEVPAGKHAERLLAAFGAFRRWGLEQPTEFALIFGSPIPGYQAPETTRPAGERYTGLLLRLLAEAHGAGALRRERLDVRVPPALERQLLAFRARQGMADLPVPVLAFALSAWVRLHGVVALEVFGHLRPAVGDGTPLFEQEVGAIMRQAGLTPRRERPARS
ncbi:MAG TPA: TetR/AcrR family transcriptional regulator [Actinomycetota bacterium]|nr:TetR/AcrR family transcriptional regulator [Actinomycetota bacterium]